MRHRNRILLQLLHGDRHRALQLRVMTVVHRFRVLLHFYIRRDTMVLHVPFAGRDVTPWFSTSHSPAGLKNPKLGAVTTPPSIRVGYCETPISPPQVRLPTSVPMCV